MNKIAVIAWQTIRSYVRDRILHSVLIFSVLFVAFSFFLSSLTIVESRKIMLDFGLSAISIIGILIALFLGVTVVGREIEKRTIYTILAKPVSRPQYLVGKFVGSAVVALLVQLLNALTLWLILLQLGEGIPDGFVAANYLMLLESWLVLALALFFSLNLSSLFLAASISAAFFLIGRSNRSLAVIAQKADSAPVRTILRALRDILPSLDRYNIRELVAYGKPYPAGMTAVSTGYFCAYLALLIAASVIVLRKKDLG